MKFKNLPENMQEEMVNDWLWNKYDIELYNKAIKQVEKEEGFWRSLFGVRQKIRDRQWKLFEELKHDVFSESGE